MESNQFRNLVESVNNLLSGVDADAELQEAQEIVADYLDSWFGEDLTEDIEDESIEDALVTALELAEAIEIVLSERKNEWAFGKPARTASDLADKASRGALAYDRGYDGHDKRGKKVRDAAVKRATQKYGKVVGAAVKARASRNVAGDEYGDDKAKAKTAKLDAFIARRTGGK